MYSFDSFADRLLELYELLQFAIAHGMHTERDVMMQSCRWE
jgi:hypothetical protein